MKILKFQKSPSGVILTQVRIPEWKGIFTNAGYRIKSGMTTVEGNGTGMKSGGDTSAPSS